MLLLAVLFWAHQGSGEASNSSLAPGSGEDAGHASHASGSKDGASSAHGTAGQVHSHRPPVPDEYRKCYYEAHPYDALAFFFVALTLGTAVMFLTMLPTFHGVQQTVVVFVLGLVFALVGEFQRNYESMGMIGHAYCMWMNMDPHLLIFSMLPALLTGDAMTIDTAVARRVWKQCIHLAGPGVLFCSFATALFLWWYLPYGWSFLLCLTVGSILAATDPVAVVSLLKELGASPALTVQIQGESLLNDGTAMVLYGLTYKMLEGEDFGVHDLIDFLVKVVLLATVTGCILGWLCTVWIRLSCMRLDHHSSFVQISITLLCAYWSFILAEGVFGMSGVLSTVCSALVLADSMWPHIVSKESMDTAWHMFEFMGNTAIFFLAGAWTGSTMFHVKANDYLHLIVIYAVCVVLRAAMLLMSLPVLRLLVQDRQPVSIADAAVMCWGGLRGAVGLSLAMHLSVDRAGGTIDQTEGKRVLFYTSGIAALTLLVNATTCPMLVRWLGIARPPATRRTVMEAVCHQLANEASRQTRGTLAEHNAEEVCELTGLVESITVRMVNDMKHHALDECEKEVSRVGDSTKSAGAGGQKSRAHRRGRRNSTSDGGPKLAAQYLKARSTYALLPPDLLELLRFPRVQLGGEEQVDSLCELASRTQAAGASYRVVKEAFLGLLRTQYWAMNDAGEFHDDGHARSTLLESVGSAFESSQQGLADLRVIVWQMVCENSRFVQDLDCIDCVREFGRRSVASSAMSMSSTGEEEEEENAFVRVMRSRQFQWGSTLLVAASTVVAIVEWSLPEEHFGARYDIPLSTLVFAVGHLFEFAVCFGALERAYFCDSPWNAAGLALLLLGVVGSALELVLVVEGHDGPQTGLMKGTAKVLRVLWDLRLAARAYLTAKERGITSIDVMQGWRGALTALRNASHEDATMMSVRYLHILTCFAVAHLHCQEQFIQYFGKRGEATDAEVAQVLIYSRVEVFNAAELACKLAGNVEGRALEALYVLRESSRVSEELLRFIAASHTSGILGSREAERLQHPLKAHMRSIGGKLQSTLQGNHEKVFEDGRDSTWLNRTLGLVQATGDVRKTMGIARETLSGEKLAGSEWAARLGQNETAKTQRDLAAVAPGPCAAALPPPPPSPPPSLPTSIQGSPLASPRCPRCPTPPPQDVNAFEHVSLVR